MKHLAYLNKYLYKYRYRLLAGIFFVAVSNFFGVMFPVIIRFSFDLVKDNIAFYRMFDGFALQNEFKSVFQQGLLLFGIAVLAIAVLKGIFMFFMRQTIIVVSRLIEYDLKNEIYTHYQRSDVSFFKKNKTGDLMSRITEDVSRVRMYLGPALMYGVNLLFLFILVISVMITVNPMLTFFVLLPLPVLSISIYFVNNIINRKSEAIQRKLSGLTSSAQEIYSGVRVMKTYVQEKMMSSFFDKECEEYKEKSLDLAKVEAFFFPLMLLLIGLSTILTIYVGGVFVIDGRITTGNIAEFVIYVNMLTWPVTAIGWVASTIQRAAASQERINEFLNTEPQIFSSGLESEVKKGSIEFKNVNFNFPDSNIDVLKNVNFKLEAGKKMAIIGKTGSGKSTVTDLIVRLYDITSGEILIDGIPIREYDLFALRRSIGYVPQDVFLFSDTIENNIVFGVDEPSLLAENTAQKYADMASIGEDIEDLPQKYQTRTGERGISLSGGQKQRVSIARALIKEPKILLLDDCLSAVDAKTEKNILSQFRMYLKDKTAIIITHRIFTLLDFDKIIVMNQGKIAEEGTHNELMAKKGMYYQLYQQQKKDDDAA